jgi:hypothetical protein
MGQCQDNSLDGPEFAIEPNATILASEMCCAELYRPAEGPNIVSDRCIQVPHLVAVGLRGDCFLSEAHITPEPLLLNPRIPMPNLLPPTDTLTFFTIRQFGRLHCFLASFFFQARNGAPLYHRLSHFDSRNSFHSSLNREERNI